MHPQPWRGAWQRRSAALNFTRLQQHFVRPRELHGCPGNPPCTVGLHDLPLGDAASRLLVLEVRRSLRMRVSGQLLTLLSSALLCLYPVGEAFTCAAGQNTVAVSTTVGNRWVPRLPTTGRPDLP